MSSSSVSVLKALFIVLDCLIVSSVIYTVATDGSPFRKELLTPMHAMILSNSLLPIVSPAPGAGHRSSSSTCIETKQCKTIRELQQIHAHIIKTGGIRDPVTAAEILHLYALSHFRDLPYARTVFNCMETPNCFSWNTIIRAFAESDDASEALNLYCKMLNDEFVRPNRYTIPSVLKACAHVSGVREGRQVHCQVVKLGLVEDGFILSNLLRMYVIASVMDDAQKLFNRNIRLARMSDERGQNNVVLWNVMVDGFIRNGDIGAARNLFDRMSQRSVVSWNEMIAGYAQNGFFKEALEVFCDMQISNTQPNYLTLVSVLPAVSRLGSLDLGKWLHAYAEKNRIKLDEVLGSAFIHMYAKCGDIEKALKLFEALPQRNVVTWNAIIGGLAMHGRANDALSFFFEMEKSGIAPTDVTFISVLNACSHAGLVDEGRSCFNKMDAVYGIRPRLEHYGCMVDMLGRSGLPEEAEKLVLNMPIEADDVIWKALLSACRIHGKIEIGKRVAEHLMGLAPQDSGCYVLLSNLYASLGDWEAVAKVRLMMKEMGIRKDPGCSSIIIDGIVYEFLVEDDLHPRAKEIHSMLEEMASKLRSVGYRPDTSHVLLKVGEEKKETILHYHSEKIAIAFGLISTSPSTTLQITKNLRICGDCHSAIKLISKLYDRKIIVRDCNRFHHFSNGSCSCMDYW